MIRGVVARLPRPLRRLLRRMVLIVMGPDWLMPPRTRSQQMLEGLSAGGQGLEIGPSYSPVAPRTAGYRVDIADVMNREALRRKYAGQNVNIEAIEEVDFLLDGRGLAELTGRPAGYDWIIASHVIEHVPDLVGFLLECESVLRDDGVLSLAVPDQRYGFDRMRMTSGIGAILDAHQQGRIRHSVGNTVDYYLNVMSINGLPAWTPSIGRKFDARSITFPHGKADAVAALGSADGGCDVDIHAWCFTPSSFRLLMSDLHDLGLVKIREVRFQSLENEFLIQLARGGVGPGLTRLQLLRQIELELAHSKAQGSWKVH